MTAGMNRCSTMLHKNTREQFPRPRKNTTGAPRQKNITNKEGDSAMKKTGNRISILQQAFLKYAGGILGIFLAGLLLSVISMLAATPVSAGLESECKFVSPRRCTECHPKNPGKCNLVARHYKKADCNTCHSTCVEAATASFDHTDYCLGCHPSALDGQLHRKHERRLNCANCHGKKILIVTDSKHGTTYGYSDKLGEALCKKGFQVDVGRAHKMLTTNISGYDGYIIGSPTYWGFPLKDLRKFLEINSAKLAQKPTAYLYNSLEGAETGNVFAKAFLQFAYNPVLINYPTIFPVAQYLQSQVPPNGTCDLSINPFSGMPRYTNCDVPAWVGLMPGQWRPRNGFPVEYMPMELFGFGGYKPYYREDAAVEYAQTLVDIKFFDGACGPNNIAPQVTVTATPTSGNQPLTVNFTATATDADGTIQSYLWNFGDGATSNLANPVHVYSCPGPFTAKVKVSDNSCGITVKTLTITVASIGGPPTFVCSVAPVFKKYCNDCHGFPPTNAIPGGLSTRSCQELQLGGNSGPAIVPGNKEASLLYQEMLAGDMPPAGTTKATPTDIASIGAWIDSLTGSACLADFCSTACGH